MPFDLKKQLVFYGAYHHNKVNVGIHVVCVPTILMSALLLGTNTPNLPLPSFLRSTKLPLNLGTATALLYSALYIGLEPVAGLALTPLLVSGAALMNSLRARYGKFANRWAVAVHVVAWLVQFVGHGKFEGRAPALLDNLVQAVFLAPFFVWMEVLFKLGYRPQLKKDVETEIVATIARFRAEKEVKEGK